MKILVHHCIAQEVIAYGLMEPSQELKCKCRKRISLKRASKLVADGDASWVVAARMHGEREQICRLCKADETFLKCANCHGKGRTLEPFVEDTPGSDILLVSRNPQDAKDKKSYFLKQKTPRTATIEANHMEMALDNPEVRERVEDYGWMIQLVLHDLGAEIKDRKSGKTIPGYEGHPEPANNKAKWEGRDYDKGRCI